MKRLLSLAILVIATLGAAVNAHAIPVRYTAILDGPSEEPPVPSPGTGTALVEVDTTAHTLRVMFDFADLVGNTTAAHIHGPTAAPGTGTAGVITATPFFPGFPIGVTSGSYDGTFDTTLASTFNATFVTAQGSIAAAELALAAILEAGTAYLNIHTTFSPGGEIRGFLQPVSVSAPTTLALLLTAGLLLAASMGRRRTTS